MSAKADKPADRQYLIMTDSHRPFDKTVLARVKPALVRQHGFWTDSQSDRLWIVDAETADEALRDLSMNNPRKVRLEKALAVLDAQNAPEPEAEADAGPGF
ncbi:MAG: hypothetical protein ABJN42_21620 [Roseibium sp.]|uniref:hypothetical protein n=1 Tax=Roseibium sp. TaxID=1936156 RepID=UPI00329961ED